jgi:hypothetical protein
MHYIFALSCDIYWQTAPFNIVDDTVMHFVQIPMRCILVYTLDILARKHAELLKWYIGHGSGVVKGPTGPTLSDIVEPHFSKVDDYICMVHIPCAWCTYMHHNHTHAVHPLMHCVWLYGAYIPWKTRMFNPILFTVQCIFMQLYIGHASIGSCLTACNCAWSIQSLIKMFTYTNWQCFTLFTRGFTQLYMIIISCAVHGECDKLPAKYRVE